MISEQLLEILACPVDGRGLHLQGTELICDSGHKFMVEDDIAVLTAAVRREALPRNMKPCPTVSADGSIDRFVNEWLVNTNGNLYWRARGALRRYPIPD